MAHSLDVMVSKLVSIITTDGKHYLGQLRGFDQAMNLILDDSVERFWSTEEPFKDVETGVLLAN